MFSTRT
jgi:hypothetical protein